MKANGGNRTEKRILIVDDDDAIRALLMTVLRRRGFDVDAARNGVEALERCNRCNYALLLLDLMMPRMSGWELIEQLAPRIKEKGLPLVIVLTAGLEPAGLDPTLVIGAIRKPFDIPMLMDMVLGCLSTIVAVEQLPTCSVPDSRRGTSREQKPN
jgi:two-component system alkaline phosphatase synthesis response regulator PhoP